MSPILSHTLAALSGAIALVIVMIRASRNAPESDAKRDSRVRTHLHAIQHEKSIVAAKKLARRALGIMDGRVK